MHIAAGCCLRVAAGTSRVTLYTESKGLDMTKKVRPALEEVIIDDEILRAAKLALEPERIPKMQPCTICGSEAAPASSENLCWVCRRLKISAWRDSDQQMTAQE